MTANTNLNNKTFTSWYQYIKLILKQICIILKKILLLNQWIFNLKYHKIVRNIGMKVLNKSEMSTTRIHNFLAIHLDLQYFANISNTFSAKNSKYVRIWIWTYLVKYGFLHWKFCYIQITYGCSIRYVPYWLLSANSILSEPYLEF